MMRRMLFLRLVVCLGWTIGSITSFSLPPILGTTSSSRSSSSTTNNAAVQQDTTEESSSSSPQRRRTLMTGVAAALLGASIPVDMRIVKSISSSSTTTATSYDDNRLVLPVASLDEAVRLIASSCDKRFLHAVVASDYQLLYQEGTQMGIRQQQQRSSSSSSFRRQEEEEEERLFQDLQENPDFRTALLPLQLQSCQLAWSHKAQQQQQRGKETTMVSIWPLMMNNRMEGGTTSSTLSSTSTDVHYAWPQEGGVVRSDSKLIVDGIDCGRMSLEDALEGDTQVLVQSSPRGFLVIPMSMEQELIAKLQGAFLI